MVTTNAALHFFDSKDVHAEVLTDQDEWNVNIFFAFSTDKAHVHILALICCELILVLLSFFVDNPPPP